MEYKSYIVLLVLLTSMFATVGMLGIEAATDNPSMYMRVQIDEVRITQDFHGDSSRKYEVRFDAIWRRTFDTWETSPMTADDESGDGSDSKNVYYSHWGDSSADFDGDDYGSTDNGKSNWVSSYSLNQHEDFTGMELELHMEIRDNQGDVWYNVDEIHEEAIGFYYYDYIGSYYHTTELRFDYSGEFGGRLQLRMIVQIGTI